MAGYIIDDRFSHRLHWNGSKNTVDVQDGSIYILNVTYNDTGTYRCYFDRNLFFSNYEFHTNDTKFITINVVGKGTFIKTDIRNMNNILTKQNK